MNMFFRLTNFKEVTYIRKIRHFPLLAHVLKSDIKSIGTRSSGPYQSQSVASPLVALLAQKEGVIASKVLPLTTNSGPEEPPTQGQEYEATERVG